MAENTHNYLSLLIFLPVIGAIVVGFLQAGDASLKRFGLGVTLINLMISIPVIMAFDRGTSQMQFVERYPWVPAFNIEYAV
ncbi:MAG TPA: NADH-quinone oxidoreductase subunit M, partial [Nitrospiria bacterium]|nr:NADH-quinone oxidoreductase subunit M [Nitrospiria bacterium]